MDSNSNINLNLSEFDASKSNYQNQPIFNKNEEMKKNVFGI